MRYFSGFLFLIFVCCGYSSLSQQYYITLDGRVTQCGVGPCSGLATFMGVQLNYAGGSSVIQRSLVAPASAHPAAYSFSMTSQCGPPICNRNAGASGTMPNAYKGSVTMSVINGSGSFTYCWEPALPAVQVAGTGTTPSVTVSIPVWGNKYEWEVAKGAGAPVPLQTIGDGVTAMESSQVVVTTAMLQSLFGATPYGENFSFRVKVTGCNTRTTNLTTPITFTEPAPTVSLVGKTRATCYQSATGTVTISIANPVVNNFYINCYNRTTGVSFPVPDASQNATAVHTGSYTIKGLRAGLWDFQIVNDAAMAANTWLEDVQVDEPTQVTVSFSAPPYNGYAIRCSGGTGDVTAIGNGGEGGYKDFVWNTGSASATLSGVFAGTYTVTLKDKNDCASVATPVSLSAPPVLSVSATSPRTYGAYEVKCHDQANGTATAAGAGGAGGYSYSWSTGAGGASISGLAANTYTVTVTDGNGCTAPGSVQLHAPDPIAFTIDQVQGLTCKGDKTAIFEVKPVVSTVIGTAKYSWSGGETEATIYDKGAGTYTVTVSDDQGCSTAGAKVLADAPGYIVSLASGVDYNGTPIRCSGDFNGKLVSTVRDAGNAVTTAQGYEWWKDGTVFSQAQATQDGLGRGAYKVIITYNTVCKAEAEYVLNDPDPVAVSTTATTSYHGQAISCFNAADGNVKALVTGGTGAYSYLWNTGIATPLLTDLGAGIYSIVVKDVNGCQGNSQITLANPIEVKASILDVSDYTGYGVSCALSTDGTMTAYGSGGTGVYSYSWSNSGRTTAVNGSLGKGIYTVMVSDNNGCHDEASETITEPPVLEATIGSYTDVACNGGSDGVISLAVTGGAGGYEYSRNGTSWIEEADFTGLPIGTYTLTVRDDNNCSASAMQKLIQPPALTLSFKDIEPAFCADPRGGATADVSGGVTEYTYSWTDIQGNVVGTAMRLSNEQGGIYTVLIHDAHNCPITDKVGITSTDGAQVDYTATAALCHDSSDGSAMLSVAGDGPFIIEWPDGQRAPEGVNLKGGDYIVSVTDGHDCTVIEEVTVPAPEALGLAVASFTAPTCNGDCDGALTLVARGGTGTYEYTWNNQHGVSQTGLCKGTYAVVLTDVNNCRLEQPVVLNEPDVLTLKTERSTLATCTDGCDGKLMVSAIGGNGGYAYSWDGGITGSDRSSLCPGDYSVMVTDVRGCVGSVVITLANTPPVRVDLGGGVTLCVGQTYTLNAGAGWKTIQWSGNGLNSNVQAVTIKDPGSYWLEVLDNNGCVGRDTFLLETSYDLLQASFMIPAEAAAGDTVAMVDISWPLPESVQWDLPLEMKQVSAKDDIVLGQFNATGTYAVGITAHLGECVDYVEKNIVVLEGDAGSTDGRLGYEEYVKAFGLYANPNDGSFDVVVDLADVDDIMLSVWSSQTGALMGKVSEKGNASYSVHVDLRPLSAGAYVLRLDHGKGSSYLRFVVR